MSRILLIDDDPGVRDSMERTLRAAGYGVQSAASGEEGFELARGGAFDVILSDMRMPGISGLDILRQLRDMRVDSAFIIMTGFGTVDTAVEAMKLGAVDFVQKPFFRDELLMRVRSATERRQLARQVDLLQRQVDPPGSLGALIGTSPAMQRVKDLIPRAAAAGGAVLITGETGTGKELVARAIHTISARGSKPFVALNCAALNESLLENELFGHARGAFTGAAGPRAGLIEHATGGTLFLDEIGTMPRPLQAKLLRALESGEVRRIGENETRRVDVRFLAATNLDIQSAIDNGDFRTDLFYRLNVVCIEIPALRERREDISVLIEHFVEKHKQRTGKHVDKLDDEVVQALLKYDWPGNVRELENTIERAVVLATGRRLTRETVWLMGAVAPASNTGLPSLGLHENVEWAERETIRRALERSRGVKKDAAELMGISQRALSYYLAKYRID